MNPNVCEKRGCFIRKEENGKFVVVDYPTWSFRKYGLFVPYQNEPLSESVPAETEFDSEAEARKFCEDENYVVCSAPRKPADKPVEYESQYDDCDFN